MTLASSRSRIDYRGNGSTVAFPVPFRFLNTAHVSVYLFNATTSVETLLTTPTHYSVSGANQPQGGTVTMVTAPAADEVLTIIRDVPIDQLINFRENEALSANKIEFALDKITMILQQLDEVTRRAVVLKVTTEANAGVDAPIGFTSTFPAKVTGSSASVDGAYDFVEQQPAAAGGWNDRAGGIEGEAYPLDSCVENWTDDLPIYVMIMVHIDADGNTAYYFGPPAPCGVVDF